MENTSAAASVSFVALSRIAGDRDVTALGSYVGGTGLSSSWNGTGLPSTGNQPMHRVRTASEHNSIDLPAMTQVAAAPAAAKQGAPPRGTPR